MSCPESEHPKSGGFAARGVLDRGDVVNVLGRFRRELAEEGDGLSVAGNRLIMRRLEALGVFDGASASFSGQLSTIARVVAEVVPLGVDDVEERLRACCR